MTATIIPFPLQTPAIGSLEHYVQRVTRLRPEWTQKQIELSAELLMMYEQGAKKRAKRMTNDRATSIAARIGPLVGGPD